MLENWYKEKRSILDFRRGPLGPHFDGFSDYLKERGYTIAYGKKLLGTCCQFNAYLIERGISHCSKLSEAMTEPFLKAFVALPQPLTRGFGPGSRCSLRSNICLRICPTLKSVRCQGPSAFENLTIGFWIATSSTDDRRARLQR
jgi:hypothetical protein